MYDALTTSYRLSCPTHGETSVRLSRFRRLDELPGPHHPAVYSVVFACGCGDEHPALVAHDELDLAPGEAKLKFGGGTAGHNGLRDIQAQLGTASFWRLRLGVGHPRDTQAPEREVVDYVLKPPGAEDRSAIDAAIDRALTAWPEIAAGDMERAMTLLHTRPRAPEKDRTEGESAPKRDARRED